MTDKVSLNEASLIKLITVSLFLLTTVRTLLGLNYRPYTLPYRRRFKQGLPLFHWHVEHFKLKQLKGLFEFSGRRSLVNGLGLISLLAFLFPLSVSFT